MLTTPNKSPSDDQELLRTGSEVKRHNLIVSTRSPRLLVLDPEYPNSVHEIRICVLHMLNVQRGANRKGRAELPGGQWQACGDREAAVGAGAGVQLAAEQVDPLTHADQAVAGAVAGPAAEPVVADLQAQVVVAVADQHARGARTGVPDGVGEGLLDDPVGRQVHPGGRGRGSPWISSRASSPACLTCSTSTGSWSRPGCGPRLGPEWSSSERSTPSSRRISPSAWRPMALIESNACAAIPGSRSTTTGPASAWTTIMLTWWAMTSCSSLAMRVRSSAAARPASSSRSRSSRTARASSSAV